MAESNPIEAVCATVLARWQELNSVRGINTILVAVSGGLDSQVLLDVLYRSRATLAIELYLAHLDHGLRAQSAVDARFVQVRAAELGLDCEIGRIDVQAQAREQGLSLEEAARNARYGFLNRISQQVGAPLIALGHHADDQAETVLLRLLRGSGSTGLGAMQEMREGRYIRPLLTCARGQLEAYAAERQLAFREDASNQDLRFGRNKVRHRLIPLLKREFNPGIIQVLERTARVLQAEDSHLDELAQTALETVVCEEKEDKLTLAVPVLVDYHIAIQRRIIRLVLQRLLHTATPFGFTLVDTILDRLTLPKQGLWQFNPLLWGQRTKECFILRRGHPEPFERAMVVPGCTQIPERQCSLIVERLAGHCFADLKPQLGPWVALVDAGRTGAELVVRSARPGDRFRPLGMQGRKKLSDFLIDVKWPRILRPDVLVVEGPQGIVWVVGGRPDEACRVGPHSAELLYMQCRPLDQGTNTARRIKHG